MMYERMDCRLCGGKVFTKLTLNPTPIANLFPKGPCAGELYQLELKECEFCHHVQIGHVIDDKTLYGQAYKYFTPDAQRPALEKQAKALFDKYGQQRVLEIGANNGLFLDALTTHFKHCIGVDPSTNHPIRVCQAPFNMKFAKGIGHVGLIVANNVFAHIDDLNSVFEAIDACLLGDGNLVFEVQYFGDMAKNGLFDMIYHEHRDYHTLMPLVGFLAKHHLAIKEVEHLKNHGGSVRIHCGRGDGIAILEKEIDWFAFTQKIADGFINLSEQIDSVSGDIALLGAPAKACTLIHQFGLKDRISYAVDCTPEKHGRYIAGTAIEIYPEEVLRHRGTKNVLLTAWNYEDVFRTNYPELNFIVPFCNPVALAA